MYYYLLYCNILIVYNNMIYIKFNLYLLFIIYMYVLKIEYKMFKC